MGGSRSKSTRSALLVNGTRAHPSGTSSARARAAVARERRERRVSGARAAREHASGTGARREQRRDGQRETTTTARGAQRRGVGGGPGRGGRGIAVGHAADSGCVLELALGVRPVLGSCPPTSDRSDARCLRRPPSLPADGGRFGGTVSQAQPSRAGSVESHMQRRVDRAWVGIACDMLAMSASKQNDVGSHRNSLLGYGTEVMSPPLCLLTFADWAVPLPSSTSDRARRALLLLESVDLGGWAAGSHPNARQPGPAGIRVDP